jgi:cytochrome c-type biogenesis protein CcmF
MPWLAATAFLHSVMIQEKRGMLKVWNVLLVILMFSLSLFGTFLTRSGILNSIHDFTESAIGPWFLGFIVFVVVGSLALVFARLPLLRSRTRLESLVSREATFLYNNLLLVALCLTILWGVIWPIVTEAVRGESSVVAGPYYNFFLRVFGLPLLLLMGLAPLIAWRRASLRSVGGAFAWPAAFATLTAIVLLVVGAGSSPAGLLAYTFSAFVLGSIAYEFVRGTRARRGLAGGSWLGAFSELVARNRRRYGGYVVHAAIVMLAIGVAGSSAYDTTRSARLDRGESMRIRDYELTYRGTVVTRAVNARELRALVDVRRDGEYLGTLRPGKNSYDVEQQVSSEAAIRSDRLTLEDLFLILDGANDDGSAQLQAFVKPLVNLIWLAGLVFFGGALIALWPDPVEQRRLQERYALQPA